VGLPRQRPREGERNNGSGIGGNWAVGCFLNLGQNDAGGLLFLSKIFSLFPFLIFFDFCLKTFAKPSNLNLGQTLKFVKLSLCY
jgi:hypothetical protein